MQLAYLTTSYPAVSHTFIRRELLEIERRGHSVLRLAIRPSENGVVDDVDHREFGKTVHFMSEPFLSWLYAVIAIAVTRPMRFFSAGVLAIRMGRRSERGMLRHVAYLVEACYFTRLIYRKSVQHVHVHFGTNAAAVARLIRKLGGPSYSFTVHGPDEFDAPRSFDLEGKAVDAAFVVAISDFCAAQLRRWVPYEHWRKIQVVHCTVGEDFLTAARPVPPDSTTIVCVGRLCPQKAQLLLVDALQQIRHSVPNGRLVLAGGGEMRGVVEDRIAELGLEDRVEITGWIDEQEVRRRILEARALVLPSFAEGLPMVIMEAFALGRPVISTYVAAIPELVRSNETGWLVAPGRVDALADAMREAYEIPLAELADLAEAGRRLIQERHQTCIETQRLDELFRSLC